MFKPPFPHYVICPPVRGDNPHFNKIMKMIGKYVENIEYRSSHSVKQIFTEFGRFVTHDKSVFW